METPSVAAALARKDGRVSADSVAARPARQSAGRAKRALRHPHERLTPVLARLHTCPDQYQNPRSSPHIQRPEGRRGLCREPRKPGVSAPQLRAEKVIPRVALREAWYQRRRRPNENSPVIAAVLETPIQIPERRGLGERLLAFRATTRCCAYYLCQSFPKRRHTH